MLKKQKSGEGEKEFVRAKAAAFRFLSARRRTCGEVARRLLEKGFAADVVQKTVSFLQDYSLLDDLAYARAWIEKRAEKYGYARLKKDLQAKGISPEIVRQALAGMDSGAEFGYALALAEKRLARQDRVNSLPGVARFLEGRGFSPETIRRVCRNLGDGALSLTDF